MTLANHIFWTLPGSERGCATLANAFFPVCQGSTFMNKTAPPTPFPAALRLNRAAISIPSGAPPQPRRNPDSQRRSASTAPPTPFPAALRLNRAAIPTPSGALPQPCRHPDSQRRSASTAPPAPFSAALHFNSHPSPHHRTYLSQSLAPLQQIPSLIPVIEGIKKSEW